MNSALPKVLHEVCGRPMLQWVIDACREAGVGRIIVVVGHHGEQVISRFVEQGGIDFVNQDVQLGTGHAVMCCRDLLAGVHGPVLVLAGDGPLIRAATLKDLLDRHREERAAVTLATAELADPSGYGRILRDGSGVLRGIVEHNDCDEAQRRIQEVNVSYYCFDAQALLGSLEQLSPNNAKGEYYLTDAVHLLIGAGRPAAVIRNVAAEDVLGVNDRRQLAEVNAVMQRRIQARVMSGGVSLVDPATTWIDAGAEIGEDTVILPFSYIGGPCRIGRKCRIGPHAHVRAGSQLADGQVQGAVR